MGTGGKKWQIRSPRWKIGMITGQFRNSLDEKGRLLIPAKIRNEIAGNILVITRGLDRCLWVFPPEQWKKVSEGLMAAASPFTKRARLVNGDAAAMSPSDTFFHCSGGKTHRHRSRPRVITKMLPAISFRIFAGMSNRPFSSKLFRNCPVIIPIFHLGDLICHFFPPVPILTLPKRVSTKVDRIGASISSRVQMSATNLYSEFETVHTGR